MDANTTQFALGVAAFVPVLVLAVIYLRKPRSALPLPPGPPGEFLLGHLRVVPSHKPELAYEKWGKEYSQSPVQPRSPRASVSAESIASRQR